MRGQLDPQSSMFHYFSPESRVPADHPLRRVKRLADRALGAISGELDALYSSTGRPSIPPERLLKAQLLIALYSVRSDRQFCEQLDYNILFRWFLDMDLESPTLDQSNFSRLRERLVATDVARRFFDEVVNLAAEGFEGNLGINQAGGADDEFDDAGLANCGLRIADCGLARSSRGDEALIIFGF